MIAVGIVLFVLAAGLLILGALAASKKLPGNSVLGLRVAEVRKSREAWDTAHAVAGPVWILAGVALVFGGFIALRASGWGWVFVALAVIAAIIAFSVGSNLGAKAAFLYDAAQEDQGGCSSEGGCNCGSGGCGGDDHAGESAPQQINLDAVRQAAQDADNS